MSSLKMLVSIHDVTPWHLERIERAERVLADLGIDRVTYMLVPNFHGRAPIARDADFRVWCRADRPFLIDWFLHGYFHHVLVAGLAATRRPTIRERLVAGVMTSGEGEFQTLREDGIRARLQNGCRSVHASVGHRPAGFVAPAWLFNDDLAPALKSSGFRFTEDHTHVWDVQTGMRVSCPAITWASRTALRRQGSRMLSAWLSRRWGSLPAVRVALHPSDFDVPELITSIRRTLETLRRDHVCALSTDLFDAPSALMSRSALPRHSRSFPAPEERTSLHAESA